LEIIPENSSAQEQSKWYFKDQSLVIGFLCVGPFVLPLVWFNPAYSPRKKIVITGIILFLTFGLVLLTKELLTQYLGIYDQILNEVY